MLRITLDEFRCWNHLDITIPLGEITLIKGNSGAGKTTILQAITWCLYGNTRSVHPNHLEKAKTKVTISTPQFTITRQKNPNRLLLVQGTNTYEDKVAQSTINNLFVDCETWMSSCYISQGCRNAFLTSSNSGKMELLNSIAFHEENPSEFIEKIDVAIKEADIQYKLNLERFNENLSLLTTILSSVDTTKSLDDIQTEEIKKKILTLSERITDLETVRLEKNVKQNMLDKLTLQLDKIKEVIIPDPDPVLKQLQEKYGEVNDVTHLLQQRDSLSTNLGKIFVDKNLTTEYTTEDYQNTVYQEITYQENYLAIQKLGIDYNQESISELSETLKDTLSSQEYLKLEKELKLLKSQASEVNLTPKEIIKPDLSKHDTTELFNSIADLSKNQGILQSAIGHLRKGLDVIRCPKCDEALRYNFGKLSLAGIAPVSKDELSSKEKELAALTKEIIVSTEKTKIMAASEFRERNNFEQEIQKEQKRLNSLQIEWNKNEEIKKKIVELEEKLKVLPETTGKILTPQEVSQYQIAIAKLADIKVVEEPKVSSKHIQKCFGNKQLLNQKLLLENEYSHFLQTIPEKFRNESLQVIRDYSNKVKNYNRTVQTLTEEKIQTEHLKKSLVDQISSIVIPDDPSSEIKLLATEKECLVTLLALSEEAKKAIAFHGKVMEQREEVVVLNEDLGCLNLLKLKASETECKVLQQVVDGVNCSIQSVCSCLFDKDILINLNLFKTLKTNQNTKPSVNFSINYQGGTFDSIGQLSGGEGDRVSLAFTLALNRLSSCPILMLDESLSSLDLTMKETTINAIIENTNSTVVVIMHDGIEGIFNNVVNLDEMNGGRY